MRVRTQWPLHKQPVNVLPPFLNASTNLYDVSTANINRPQERNGKRKARRVREYGNPRNQHPRRLFRQWNGYLGQAQRTPKWM